MSILQAGPILFRELFLPIRKPKMFLIISVYLVILSGAFLFLWRTFPEATYVFNPTLIADYGQKMIRVIFGLMLIVFFFVPPFLTCRSISSEMHNDTIRSLLVTEMSPGKIIITKLLSSLGFLHLYFFLVIPIIALAFILGGVSPQEILHMVILIECVGIFMGSVGLLIGLKIRKIYYAVMGSILIPLMIFLVQLFPIMIPVKHNFHPFQALLNSGSALQTLKIFNPIAAFIFIFKNPSTLYGSIIYDRTCDCALIHLVLGILITILVVKMLREVILSVNVPSKKTSPAAKGSARKLKPAAERKGKIPIFDWQNPVLVKEIRSRLFGKKDVIIRIVYTSIIISELFLVFVSMSNIIVFWIWRGLSGMLMAFAVLQIFILSFFTIMVQSLLVPLEIENRTWDLLRNTALNFTQIIYGKFFGGQWYSLLIFAGSLPPLIIMSIISGNPGRALWIVCILLITMLNMGLTGFLIGVNSKTSSQAINRALMVIIGFLVLTVFIYNIGRYTNSYYAIIPSYIIKAILLTNPFYAVSFGLEDGFLFILANINVTFILLVLIFRIYKRRFVINTWAGRKSGKAIQEVPADVA